MQRGPESPNVALMGDEIDLVDVIAFLWRGRLWIVGGLLAGLAAGVGYTYMKRKMPTYTSDVAVDVDFPLDLAASGQIPQVIDQWNRQLQSQVTFKGVYDAIAQAAGDAPPSYGFEAAYAQETGAGADVPKVASFVIDEPSKQVILSVNVPFTLKPEAVPGLARTVMTLVSPANESASATGAADGAQTGIPSYDFAKLEYDLFQRIQSLRIDAKDYLAAFKDQGLTGPAANILRMIAVLESHGKLAKAEVDALTSRALALVPRLLSQGAPSAAQTPPIVASMPVRGVKSLRENVPLVPSRKREHMVLVGLVIAGTFLGLLAAAATQFWNANRIRLRKALT